MLAERYFKKLRKLCEAWGGTLEDVPLADFLKIQYYTGFSYAPFTSYLGVFYHEKRIIYCSEAKSPAVGSIIHEMGHVFACKHEPKGSEEYDFFGWEYMLARQIQYPMRLWYEDNQYYGVDAMDPKVLDSVELRELSPSKRRKLFRQRVAVARDSGLLDGDKPVAIR